MIPPETTSIPPSPALGVVLKVIRHFETGVVLLLILLMIAVVGFSTLELTRVLADKILQPPRWSLDLSKMLEVLGYFMMVLIGLELLETIKNYLTHHALHVEVVLLVAMIAVARKVIILDMKEIGGSSMIGVAVLLFSLSGSYYLIKKGMQIRLAPPEV